MIYPEKFKAKVKKMYPDWKFIHNALDSGSALVPRYLYDSCSQGVSIERVLAATSLEELQDFAKVEKEKWALYNESYKILDQVLGKKTEGLFD